MLAREYGLACDRIVAMQVGLADGSVVMADETRNPDLFWGLRGGGGGNFGVVTSFNIKAIDVTNKEYQFFKYTFNDLSVGAEVLRTWQKWALEADRQLFTQLSLGGSGSYADGPHGGSKTVQVTIVYSGSLKDAKACVENSGLSKLLPQHCRQMPCPPPDSSDCSSCIQDWTSYDWRGIVDLFGPCGNQPDWKFDSYSRLSDHLLTDDATDAIIRLFNDSQTVFCESPWYNVIFDNYGGAIADTKPSDTAFFHRKAKFQLQVRVLE